MIRKTRLSGFKLFCVLVAMSTIAAVDGNESVNITTLSNATDDFDNEKNESLKAYEMITILLGEEGEDGNTATNNEKHVVFQNGKLEEPWRPPSSPDEESSLFYHGPYADRITFDFFFGAFPEYSITKPKCTSSVTDIAQPGIIDYQVDEEENSGSFTLVYDCQKHANSETHRNTTISVTFPVAGDMSIHFAFRKTCGGGQHKYIEFGYYSESDNEDTEATQITFASSKTQELSVGPHVSSTRVFLMLKWPAESQEFFHVIVKSDDDGLAVSVQGPVFGGVMRCSRSTMLYVIYDCRRYGKHKVSLTIPLRPFDDLHGVWEKNCGGGIVDGLNIGTSFAEPDNVVQKGVTQENWLMALSATSGRIGDQAPVVNVSTRVQDLWISNDGIPLQTASEIITVEKPDMLSVYGSRSLMRASGLQDQDGDGFMASGSKMRLRLRLICKKKGRSLVLVTLPVKSFDKIDLGFVKECRAPKQHHHSGFLRTANSAMIAVSLFLLTVLLTFSRLRPSNGKLVRMQTISILSDETTAKHAKSGRQRKSEGEQLKSDKKDTDA